MGNYRSIESLSLTNSWLTIGVFDGVHRGHQELLHQLIRGAHAGDTPALVITFKPHPATVLGGSTDFKCLTTPEERTELLAATGVDHIITQAFDLSLASQTAEQFMRRLVYILGMRHLVIGHDTALGRGREADAAGLAEIGKGLGFSVQVVPPLTDEHGIISSTRIRQAVAAGRLEAAIADLGHYPGLRGPVVHGDGRGRHIKIPTANLHVPPGKLIPGNGVYATWAWVEGEKKASVTNIGVRPTFTPDLAVPSVETHILDFKGDLYDQPLRLEFVARLRPEQKFPSVEALVKQIHADIDQARTLLLAKQCSRLGNCDLC
jgi:riboflavin kinase / FMN adenylyltransferase